MSVRRDRKNIKYYIAELVILVMGISLSFVLNEWRITQDDRRVEEQMLMQFRDNLVSDSTALLSGVEGLTTMLKASNKLLDLERREVYSDSVAMNLLMVLNFTAFYPTDIAYQEMRSLGNSRMIRDKELLKELIQLYESDYDVVAEWVNADRTFLMNDLLPHINKTLPYARGLNFPSLSDRKKQDLMDKLTLDHTKYVIQSGQIMKQGAKVVYSNALNEVRKILEMLEARLGDQP